MPNISGSTDSGYNSSYYARKIEELEDNAKGAARRNDERIAALEKKQEANLRERDDQVERTIKDVRDNANESIAKERSLAREEVERIRNNTYDKFGRYNGIEADVLKSDLDQMKRTSEAAEHDHKQAMKRTDEAYQNRVAEIQKDLEAKTEKRVGNARDSALSSYEKAARENKELFNELKSENEKRFSNLSRERIEEQDFASKMSEKRISDLLKDDSWKRDREKTANAVASENRERMRAQDHEEDVRALNKSHSEESRVLRSQIGDLLLQKKREAKESGEASAEAVRGYDDSIRMYERLISESNDKEVARLKAENKSIESQANLQADRAIREKDAEFADVIARQHQSASEREHDLLKTFEKDHKEQKELARRDQALSRAYIDKQAKELTEQNARALENVAKANSESMSRQRQSDTDKVKQLENRLYEKESPRGSPSYTNPLVENRIRQDVMKEYESKLNAEQDRSQRSIASIQTSYADRLQGDAVKSQMDKTALVQEHASERHRDARDFQNTVSEVNERSESALKSKEQAHDREVSSLQYNNARQMDRQRKLYEEVYEMNRQDHMARLAQVRQDGEIQLKNTTRELTSKINELTRDYEKQLADQKLLHETQLDEVRRQAQSGKAESERQGRRAVDELTRSYEQRIAQMEIQQKDRENTMAQNFNEQIDKMKRAHDLILKKKG